MDTANALVALGGDRGNSVPKYDLTPAEILVLQVVHGEDAVYDIVPLDEQVERTHKSELERLFRTYGRAQPDGTKSAPAVQQLFPGAAARVPTTLSELELAEDFFKAVTRVKPHPLDHDGDGKPGGSKKGSQSTVAQGARKKRQSAAAKAKEEAAAKAAAEAEQKAKEEAVAKAQAEADDSDGIEDMDDQSGNDENLFK